MIRALIVDDEPLARQRIGDLLREHADFVVAGEADHGEQAIDHILALRPDVLFLDVQMPGLTGFDVIDAVGPEAMPYMVLITAFDVHAIRAFEVEALDYILKPFDDLRFGRALDRVRRMKHAEANAQRPGALLPTFALPRLVARAAGRRRIIDWDEIDCVCAAGNYAEVHTGSQVTLIDGPLTALAERLPSELFARIHRSAIVRLDRIADLRLEPHGDGVVTLISGIEHRVSRRYRAAIDRYLAQP